MSTNILISFPTCGVSRVIFPSRGLGKEVLGKLANPFLNPGLRQMS
jgi:hypothetical protein